MGTFEKRLAEANGAVLHKQAVGGATVELVDVGVTPTVRVASRDRKSEFALDRIGLLWADETGKFFSEDTGDEVAASDFADLALERHLSGPAGLGGY